MIMREFSPFQDFAEKDEVNQHGCTVKIEVDASGEKFESAVKIGTEGADGDQCFHAESSGREAHEGPSRDVTTPVEQDNAGHDEDGP